ncbi:hypothetical protein C4J81_15565 [Deltaproteobacteria bacterium Smac51]|nr:hypothetical protein C4J81_15565 [Deltaproteobacteria bacterium Smac51]
MTKAAATDQAFLAPASHPYLEIRTTLSSGLPYADHFHSDFSVGLILDGTTLFHCSGQKYIARKGDIVLIESGVAHSCNPIEGGPRSYHMIYLEADWCLDLLGALTINRPSLSADCSGQVDCAPEKKYSGGQVLVNNGERVVRDPSLFETLKLMVETIRAAGSVPEVEARLTFSELLGRYCHLEAGAGTAGWLAEGARKMFDRDPEHPLKVEEAARRLGLRREYFTRAFRRSTGLSPGSYHHCSRIMAARRLLRRGVSIVEAALASGYADQSHFHRMFVKYVSATPRQYLLNRSHSGKK